MIMEHGHNLDQVEESIQRTYENVKETNSNIKIAENEQKKFLGLDKVRGAFHKTANSLWGFVAWPWKGLFGLTKKSSKK